MSTPPAERRLPTLLEYLVLITLVTVGVVGLAYWKMPAFQRGLRAMVDDAQTWVESRRTGGTP